MSVGASTLHVQRHWDGRTRIRDGDRVLWEGRADTEADVQAAIESVAQKDRVNVAAMLARPDAGAEQTTAAVEAEVLDEAAPTIRRPLRLIDGHGYAATWVPVRMTMHERTDPKTGKRTKLSSPEVKEDVFLLVLRDDGAIFTDAPLANAHPLGDLGAEVRLSERPAADRLLSGAALRRTLAGERPDPRDVFGRICAVVDRFMDFNRSIAPQQTLCEMIACFVLSTYVLDALHVTGYLWPNGDRGAGKTTFLHVVAEMAYLGQVILSGGSYASLRDLADYGATLAFDDCDGMMDPKRGDPDKRTLLLAGNRRGATATFKEPAGQRGWVTRHVDAFCPRLFSAIRLPDAVLASRTIMVPLVRSTDPGRAKADPLDHSSWPCNRRRLVDDLWVVAVTALPSVKALDERAAAEARLSGRDLEPWRGILAVALWLQEEHGLTDLYARMEALSVAYQMERSDLEASDPTRVAVLALQRMAADRASDPLTFSASDLTEVMNALAAEEEIGSDGDFTNARRIGRLLERLRLAKAQRTANRKLWKIGRDELVALAHSYGIGVPEHGTQTNKAPMTILPQHGTNGTNGIMALPDAVPSCQECHVCHDDSDTPTIAPVMAPPPVTRSVRRGPRDLTIPDEEAGA